MKKLFFILIISFLLISCEEEVPPVTYTLTTQVTPTGAGTVNPSSGTYDEGTSVTITASPTTNFKFLKWTGTGSGTANPLTFKIISNTTIIAEFELIDADGDGVTDALDKCPDTPSGSTVNTEGCTTSQLDADGDGVTDDKDKCANTPDGETVDENGCSDSQIDTDGDGVFDNMDNCIETINPDQLDFDNDGIGDVCDDDDDNDEINDDEDQCPNTPLDEDYDENGCSDSQKDTDGDGVTDNNDFCPGTLSGSEVDLDGCCIKTENLEMETHSNLPEIRGYTSSATHNSIIYLSKGKKQVQDLFGESYVNSDDILMYDIDNNPNWTTFKSGLIPARYGDTQIYNDFIYLLNGERRDYSKPVNDSVERISLIDNSIYQKIAYNPYAVQQNGSDLWDFHNLIFFGGKNQDDECSDLIVKLNLNTLDFEVIGNLPIPICNTKGEIINNKLYVIGGYYGDVSDKIYIYDLENRIWESEISMGIKISATTTSKVDNLIFIRGDYNLKDLFAVFDTETNEFRTINNNFNDSRHLTSEIVNGRFYQVGGNISSFYNTMLDYVQSVDISKFCF